jgi:Fe2+ transport system protein B
MNQNIPMIPDDQDGTNINALRKHLNKNGYVSQQNNQQNMPPINQTDMQQMNNHQQSEQNNQQMMQQQMIQQQMMQQQMMQQKMMQQRMMEEQNQESEREIIRQEKPKKNISHLVSDINKSLDNYSPSNQDALLSSVSSESIEDFSDEEINEKPKDNKTFSIILKESLIILVLYVCLSFGFVKTFVGNNIKYANPRNDGSLSFTGVIIYGLLMAVLFMLIKYLIL